MPNFGTIAMVVGGAMILYALIIGVLEILKHINHINYSKAVLINNALRLQRWETARPFIQICYCGFARALIFQMIDATYDLLAYKPECPQFKALLSSLYEKLEDFPLPPDPPQAGPLFVFRPDYARIVGL